MKINPNALLNGAALMAGGAVLSSGAFLAAHAANGDAPVATKPEPVVTWISDRPCAQEDYVNCSWNAGGQGNGVGHSFIVRKMPHTGQVCYLFETRHDARRFDFCTKGHR